MARQGAAAGGRHTGDPLALDPPLGEPHLQVAGPAAKLIGGDGEHPMDRQEFAQQPLPQRHLECCEGHLVDSNRSRQWMLRHLLDRSGRSEEHTSELQSRPHLVCRLLLEKKKKNIKTQTTKTKNKTTKTRQ